MKKQEVTSCLHTPVWGVEGTTNSSVSKQTGNSVNTANTANKLFNRTDEDDELNTPDVNKTINFEDFLQASLTPDFSVMDTWNGAGFDFDLPDPQASTVDHLSEIVLPDLSAECAYSPIEQTSVITEFPHMPTELTHMPTELTHMPTELTHMPTELTHMPTELTHMPTELTHITAELTELTEITYTAHAPTEFTQTPTELVQTHTDFALTPTDFAQTPTKFAQTPIEFAQIPAELAQTPTEFAQTPTELTLTTIEHGQDTTEHVWAFETFEDSSVGLCLPAVEAEGARMELPVAGGDTGTKDILTWILEDTQIGDWSLPQEVSSTTQHFVIERLEEVQEEKVEVKMVKMETLTQEEKYRRMREQNNRASQACRAKRKRKLEEEEEEVKRLEERNKVLVDTMRRMEVEVAEMKKRILEQVVVAGKQ